MERKNGLSTASDSPARRLDAQGATDHADPERRSHGERRASADRRSCGDRRGAERRRVRGLFAMRARREGASFDRRRGERRDRSRSWLGFWRR